MAEPVRAKSISCSHCEHGTVFVHFHAADGEIVATASMDVHTAADFSEDFIAVAEAALELIRTGQASTAVEIH